MTISFLIKYLTSINSLTTTNSAYNPSIFSPNKSQEYKNKVTHIESTNIFAHYNKISKKNFSSFTIKSKIKTIETPSYFKDHSAEELVTKVDKFNHSVRHLTVDPSV